MPTFGYDEERDRVSDRTELHIHGIGGSTPERLLRDLRPVQVGGDEIAGFYRPRDDTSEAEAYSWGGLTARANVRAFWILLLPFALANVAGWMIPPGRRNARSGYEGLVRAVALGTTVAFVGLTAGIVVDLVMLQCGMQEACTDQSVFVGWMGIGAFQSHPTRLVALGVLVPALAVLVLWVLGRRSRERYEERLELAEVGPSALRNPLAQPGFWESTDQVKALANLHIAASLASLAAAAEWFYFRLDRFERGETAEFGGPWTQWFTGVHVVGLLAIILLLAALILVWRNAKVFEKWATPVRRTAVGLFALAVLDGLRRDDTVSPIECSQWLVDRGLTECSQLIGTWFAGFTWSMVFVPLMGLLVLLLARGLYDGYVSRGGGVKLFGTGPAVAVATGLIILTSLMAGTALWAAELLGNRPSSDGSPPFIRVFSDWEVVSLGLVVYTATLLGWVAIRSAATMLLPGRRADRRRRIDAIETSYFKALGKPIPAKRSSERMRWLADIERRRTIRSQWVPALAQPLALGVTVALGAALIYIADRELFNFELFLQFVFVDRHPLTDLLLVVSRWVIVALPGVAVTLLWRSYRNPDIRRNVGTLWDVLTFWPRWFHPFAPPAYSARAVPEMVIRLQDRLSAHGPVVLSAHSQGSIIATAAVLTLGGRASQTEYPSEAERAARTLKRTALLTHGSPLASLYGPYFPAYFSPKRLAEVRDQLQDEDGPIRWRNLYRCTDPLGRPLFTSDSCDGSMPQATGGIDVLCPDPDDKPPEPGDPYPQVRGHSDYHLEDAYRDSLAELFGMF